jgi:hypothetical protein
LAFNREARARDSSPREGDRYPGLVGSTSGSTPTEFTGQFIPIREAMRAATSACSTSRRKRWLSCHGSEYESCEEGEESDTGPLIPRPHAIRGVLVLSGSIKTDISAR